MKTQARLSTLMAFCIAASSCAADKTFIDYFLPMPIASPLVSDVWGAPGIFPRDPKNGLEDETMKQRCYWDGQIIKSPDGKYHIFASRWDQARGHNGWFGSLAVHAVSDKVTGPYVDKGLCRPDNQGGKGHNVTAVTLAVLDVPKDEERGNDTHGSKIIVIPFDGAALDRDLQNPNDKGKSSEPSGKRVPRPLYRDPPFDAPTDPVVCFNAETQKWYMYYTARRATATDAPGVQWVHGTNIGMAESSDGGATWTYKGTADISYGKDRHPSDYTYWAPEVIWANSTYHMFLSFVPGIFSDWNHPREIVHLTSTDGIKWASIGPIDLKSDRVIDACVIQLPSGGWRMWYKDERGKNTITYADSPDLMKWETRGNAVTDYNGEGPKVMHWKGRYWLIADCWRNGQRVWTSDDCLHWTPQDGGLIGSHGDIVVSGDRAWWFYFSGGRRAQIDLVELGVVDGRLIGGDPDEPTYIDLKTEREQEK
jgi:hypothetical protein